jgi:hypothetical protein
MRLVIVLLRNPIGLVLEGVPMPLYRLGGQGYRSCEIYPSRLYKIFP